MHCRPPAFHTRRIHFAGFTLVEALVVMAVISILLGVAVTGASGLVESMGLTSAGSRVAQLVEAARQRAMTANAMTALVLVTRSQREGDGRAFAILECPPGGPWSQYTNWELLPNGMVVDLDAGDHASFLSHTPAKFPFSTVPDGAPVKYQDVTLATGTYAARIFMPGGGLLNARDPAVLQVVAGDIEGGRMSYRHRSKAGLPANYFRIALLGATGKTKVERPE